MIGGKGDRTAVESGALAGNVALRIGSPRGAVAFRVARSTFVRGLCTALIERRGFANSGIAVTP
jgi:hypothetical protein